MEKYNYHTPVLLSPAVEALVTDPDGTYVDVTFGGGGHSRKILSLLSSRGRLFAFDQDEDAQNNALDDERFTLIQSNFSELKRYLKFYGCTQVDGILGDFGVSSHQFDASNRGFSTRFEGPLDMRMDQSISLKASDVVHQYAYEDLLRLFKVYGEVKGAAKIASLIVTAREEEKITSTQDLVSIIRPHIPERFFNKVMAQVFQSLRIEVNQELEVLKQFLLQVPEVLSTGGRLVCISYHSLEDRLVKRFIREGVFEGEAEQDFFGNRKCPLKKVGPLVVPDAEEIKNNPRARSAKMRIAEKR